MPLINAKLKETLVENLRLVPLRIGNEALLQQDLMCLFLGLTEGSVLREYLLSKRDRIDFYLPYNRVGVEVKMARSGGNWKSVEKQLIRYAGSSEIDCLVLLTTSYALASVMPETIGGKPLTTIDIGGAF